MIVPSPQRDRCSISNGLETRCDGSFQKYSAVLQKFSTVRIILKRP